MKKVYVGLSGGVDSAVSAALLKDQGYDVTGVFIKIWQPEFIECTWREDRLDAMRVAASLEIAFREIDLSDEYQHEVVDTMVRDYNEGITPNPDVLCNEKIKFGIFQTWALREGADYVATGHYARIRETQNAYELLCGKDSSKDQSYFLYRLGQAQLSKALFPVGEFEKVRIREIAKMKGLPVAGRPDSQGLCFVGDVSLPEFLSRFISIASGEVRDLTGKTIGSHKGAAFYTIGQRHGIDIVGGENDHPYFVVSIDTKHNILIVSEKKDDAKRADIQLKDIHWITDPPATSSRIECQVRYHGERSICNIDVATGSLTLFEPQIISPGQSVVFYEGEVCLGGGIAM